LAALAVGTLALAVGMFKVFRSLGKAAWRDLPSQVRRL
jgi:hypothetical protein